MIIYKQIQSLAKNYYELLLDYTNGKYIREIIAIVLAAIFILGGYSVFDWYKKRQNTQAFAGLVEVSRAYGKAVVAAGEALQQSENPWEDTELMLESLARKNSGSSLSPFFIFYEAELALKQYGDYERACDLMSSGLKKLPKKSIYYDMFHVKQIKMLLDSPEESVVAQALQDLKSMSEDTTKYYYQEALYILAMYESAHGNMGNAIESWKSLVNSKMDKALIESPFIAYAEDKLKSLNIMMEARN